MSSLRKVSKAKARPYKERSQPVGREYLGQLEKRKDYRLRAGDYNSKKGKLKDLKKAALDRNPDEFYFHMVKSRLRDGEHRDLLDEQDEEQTEIQRLLLARQDLRYVDFKISVEQRKVEKLQASLHLMQQAGQLSPGDHQRVNKHTIFVEDEQEAINFNPAELFNTHPALIGRSFNRPKLSQLLASPEGFGSKGVGMIDKPSCSNSVTEESATSIPKSLLKSVDKERKKQYRELVKRLERLRELRVVSDKLKIRRDLASNKKSTQAPPMQIKKGSKQSAAVYRWPMERMK